MVSPSPAGGRTFAPLSREMALRSPKDLLLTVPAGRGGALRPGAEPETQAAAAAAARWRRSAEVTLHSLQDRVDDDSIRAVRVRQQVGVGTAATLI
ncbi:hypothetical protein CRUP_000872, partial [Coryphaenoides rupestris]